MDALKSALEKNNMVAHFVSDRSAARKLVLSMIGKDDVVGVGGSMTLEECGIHDELRKRCLFLDWLNAKDNAEKDELRRKTLCCDVFVSGTNSVTMDGKLVNTDGRGNRVAAMIFGPKKVIVVAGKNKIVKDVKEAVWRIKNVASPKNCSRLGKKTPCAESGLCADCSSPDRICSSTVILERQQSQRIHVVLVDEVLGY